MCTGIRFTDPQGNLYFGRNLDWSFSYGEKVLTVPRNFARKWFYEGTPQAKQPAVIGMGIVEEGVPLFFDCANESGLAIAGLNFPGWAQYEAAPVDGKTNVTAYEFPFWVASTFATVDEVEAALPNVAIVAKAINEKYPVSMLHWLIADKNRSIVVEYMDSGMHVHRDELDVLTNQPEFHWHVEHVRNYMAVTPEVPADTAWDEQKLTAFGSGFGMLGLPGEFSSPSRFVRAAYFNSHYPDQNGEDANVTRLFRTLSGAAMIKGGARMSDGDFEFTVYTGGYSQATKTYYHAEYDEPSIKAVRMDATDLDGTDIAAA